MKEPTHLRGLVAESPPGTKIRITLLRGKDMRSTEVTLAEQPKDAAKAMSGESRGTTRWRAWLWPR